MASPTAPVRVPSISGPTPTRRTRHPQTDDISHLTLAEVRDRLERNERVLSSALFSSSPLNSTSPSTSSRLPTSPATTPDPVRTRLLAAREALLAREAELVASGFESMSLEDNGGQGLSRSPPLRSGKARAIDAMRRQGPERSAVALPIDSTLALGERDYENAAMARFANMRLEPSRSSSGRGRRRDFDPARAERYREDDDNDIFETDEAFADAQVASGSARDQGNGMPISKSRWERNTDGDEVGEDLEDQQFCEGNDEYREME